MTVSFTNPALGDGQLDRVEMHSERGPESVRTIVKLIAAHDLVHRAQIARILGGAGSRASCIAPQASYAR